MYQTLAIYHQQGFLLPFFKIRSKDLNFPTTAAIRPFFTTTN
ncbi:hypothetical protein [uncultured Microscilla sp.]|nr:hypothetical protein [uncultured Microscilla sp.]